MCLPGLVIYGHRAICNEDTFVAVVHSTCLHLMFVCVTMLLASMITLDEHVVILRMLLYVQLHHLLASVKHDDCLLPGRGDSHKCAALRGMRE